MNCVVMAGGKPTPDDSLYRFSQGQPKALLRIGGKTILEYVLKALEDAQNVEEIVVVGIKSRPIRMIEKSVNWIPDQGSLLANGLAAVNWTEEKWPNSGHVLFSSADIPAIRGSIVDRFISTCEPFDRSVYYCFVSRESLELRYPDAKRTYVRLGDLEVAGGDMIVAQPKLATERQDLLEALINGRKKPWKIAQIVGLGTIIKLLLNRLDLTQVERTATRIIGQPVKVFLSPDAEVAMDVDKSHQLELLRDALVESTGSSH